MSVFWYDISKAVAEAYVALEAESRRPNKDFGALVRQRRKERGLPVLAREHVLPLWCPAVPLNVPSRLPDTTASEHPDDEAHVRVKIAEFRVWQAYRLLADGEGHGVSPHMLDALEEAYMQELKTWEAAAAICSGGPQHDATPRRRSH